MTDKEKIKAKIEQLMYGFNLEADIASYEDVETEKLANIKYQVCKKILEYIDSMQEESVSEELEEAAEVDFICRCENHIFGMNFHKPDMISAFKAGANWKERQFEKNRLKHCDALTKEQAQIESDFVTQHIKENNRTPTFIDAIEYGMRLKEEQIMKDATECEVKIDAGGYPYIDRCIELYDYDKDIPLAKKGDKVKIVAIKGE